jgi:hypothetical protein
MGLVNLHGTPKQWAIAHKNSPKTQNVGRMTPGRVKRLESDKVYG